jgi:hypothetical protein
LARRAGSPKRQVSDYARVGDSPWSSLTRALSKKEFNERVAVLVATGHSRAKAEHLANDDVSLDRFIALAPLCTYGELDRERHAGVRSGARLGTFPVPGNPSSGIPPAWVDLRRISTTDVTLVDVEPMRLASLYSLAQAHLQAALAKHWAYRDLSRYDELQRAFGQRITSVVPISAGKKMRVGFTLEDGTQLVFDASDKPLPLPGAPARRPAHPAARIRVHAERLRSALESQTRS